MKSHGKIIESFSTYALIIAILITGTLLRILNLGTKSLSVDEASTIYLIIRPLPDILPFMMQLHEVHPPLYFWTMKLWMDLLTLVKPPFISFEFSMKLLSVLFSLGTIYLTFLLGKKLFSQKTGLLAAFLLAVSAFHLFYSQELRMYPMLLFFMLLSLYSFLILLENPDIIRASVYITASLAALLTHYYSFYIIILQIVWSGYLIVMGTLLRKKTETTTEEYIPAFNLTEKEALEKSALLQQILTDNEENKDKTPAGTEDSFDHFIDELTLTPRSPRYLRESLSWFACSLFLITVPYLWWIPSMIKQMHHQDFTIRTNAGIYQILNLFTSLTFGETLSLPTIGEFNLTPVAAVIPLFLIGWTLARSPGKGKILTTLYLFLPIIITLTVSITRFRIFEYKYFYIITPALFMLIAEAVLNPPDRRIPKLLLILILAGNFASFRNMNWNPMYSGQDWRRAVREVTARMKSGERIIIHPSMMTTAFAYYFRKPNLISPMDAPDPARIEKFRKNSPGIWVVTTPHHPYVIKTQLLQNLEKYGIPRLVAIIPKLNPSDTIHIYYIPLTTKELENKETK